MLENLNKYKIILASNSPRRKELLSGLGVDYEVKTLPDVDESYPDGLSGEEIAKHIARGKAEAYRSLIQADELVITGVCLTTASTQKTFATVTDVTFATLTDEEVDYYVTRYQPMDKAGSYGVQEWIGFVGVENLSGSYFNVMGLPIQRLYTELKKL